MLKLKREVNSLRREKKVSKRQTNKMKKSLNGDNKPMKKE